MIRWTSVLLVLFVLATVSPARAVVVTGSFSGTITESTNAESVFDAATSLVGQPISGTFRYDTDALPPLHPVSTPTFGVWLDSYPALPFVSLTETINARTVTFGGTYYEELDLAHGNPP